MKWLCRIFGHSYKIKFEYFFCKRCNANAFPNIDLSRAQDLIDSFELSKRMLDQSCDYLKRTIENSSYFN